VAGRKAIILFGHGSRDPLWRVPIEAVAARVAVASPPSLVRCAYLELDQPDLPSVVADLVSAGAGEITIVPMFLGVGKHAREDLPKLVQALSSHFLGVQIHLRPAVGEDERVLDLLAQVAVDPQG
jgi:sirohydrochlorin cobaltochelatase